MICDVEKVLGLAIVYHIRQSPNGRYKFARIIYGGAVPLVELAILVREFSYIQILLGGNCECLRVLTGWVLIQLVMFEEGGFTRVARVLHGPMHPERLKIQVVILMDF